MAVTTIYDIAREAAVSPATVSRFLTGSAKVKASTRLVIEKVIKKHDYRPNAIARGLSTRTRLIGLMMADIRNPYYAALAVECECAARKSGFTVLTHNILSDISTEEALLDKFSEQKVEAIIQAGCSVDEAVSNPEYVARVNRLSVPMVISGALDGANCYSVRIDHQEASRLALEHLVSLGHKRIAIFGGRAGVRSTDEKVNEYTLYLARHNLPVRKDYIIEGNYNDDGGYAGMNTLLALHERPTAAIAVNDFSALGALRALDEAGLRAPGDMSLVSFDNTYLASSATPSLTSVDYDYPAFGQRLVEVALSAISGEVTARQHLIKPNLVIRSSAGRPRDA